ncbi:SpoIID/LytB domain-containing protein [Bacillus sp. DJP31]|uniref:SpoIID/LytB domain-containing protein n=1 Tax=Bacillus sp. DJP31 TaxID=3409789 RepID=UPI003BB6FF6F
MRKLLGLLILLFFTMYPMTSFAKELVEVKLVNYMGDTSKINFELKGDYVSLDPTLTLYEGINYILTVKNGMFTLIGAGETQEFRDSLVLVPREYDEQHFITINDRPYLGAIEFQIEDKINIRPVNQLPLEDYLKGVVPFEVFPTWGIETLKAQALAARTYAVSHMKASMDDTIKYQVYGGYSWKPSTTKAVKETKGEVITHHNKLIDAFYSASNGGITENNANVWGGNPISYYPIKSDPYDPTHPWQFNLSQTQVELEEINWDHHAWWEETQEKDDVITLSMKKYIQKKGFPGDIKILSIPEFKLSNDRLDSKRVTNGSITIHFLQRLIDGTILFQQLDLDQVEINRIRPLIGGNIFRSYFVDSLESNGGIYTMKGRGYGHGVGMSQWGANIMGEEGKTYEEILQFYFPGTKITTIPSK